MIPAYPECRRFGDAVFSIVAAFPVDDSGRFVADDEKIEL